MLILTFPISLPGYRTPARPRMHVALVPSEQTSADRHQVWLRRRRVRRLHCHALQVHQKRRPRQVSFTKITADNH